MCVVGHTIKYLGRETQENNEYFFVLKTKQQLHISETFPKQFVSDITAENFSMLSDFYELNLQDKFPRH